MSDQLARYLESIGRPRIAVVGDAILDEYVWGEVKRVSPEGPIPVLNVQRRETRAGGAGSVVANLARLDAEVSFFSITGDDQGGEKLRRLFESDGVDLRGLCVQPGRQTTVKTRHVGYVQHANRAMQQLLRVDDEVLTPFDRSAVDEMVLVFSQLAESLDAVLISDYDKGLLDATLVRRLREAAPEHLPFLVDPARRPSYELYRGCQLICPNRYEAQTATEVSCTNVSGCAAAAAKLANDLEIEAIALTMDADGIFLYERQGVQKHIPTRARNLTDVAGAGDMVLSVLGLVAAEGGTNTQAVQLANYAAGLEIRRLGVTPLSRQEIVHEILFEGRPGTGKLKTLRELKPIVEGARDAGQRIVFANGCFDYFHGGHLHLLQGAAQEGDVLIVALNSDASVRRLKGPSRPRFRQRQRLHMLSWLEFVDFVVVFDEDTPLSMLEALRPDVLVKGGDYTHREVIGRRFVESYGGRVVIVPHLPGFSTSALLKAGAQGSGPRNS